MKFIKLLTSAYVGGAMRHPHEGVLHIDDDDAARLVAEQTGEDVTADFSAKENKAPVETVESAVGTPASDGGSAPHQVEVAPQSTAPHKTGRRAASSQE